jgi:hypothetical protein
LLIGFDWCQRTFSWFIFANGTLTDAYSGKEVVANGKVIDSEFDIVLLELKKINQKIITLEHN